MRESKIVVVLFLCFVDSWKMADVDPSSSSTYKCTILNVDERFLLFLAGGFSNCAIFLDIHENAFFTSDSTDAIKLDLMPFMLSSTQKPDANFIDRRVLVSDYRTAQLFVPTCLEPWSPKHGQWSYVNFISNSSFRQNPQIFTCARQIYAMRKQINYQLYMLVHGKIHATHTNDDTVCFLRINY